MTDNGTVSISAKWSAETDSYFKDLEWVSEQMHRMITDARHYSGYFPVVGLGVSGISHDLLLQHSGHIPLLVRFLMLTKERYLKGSGVAMVMMLQLELQKLLDELEKDNQPDHEG